MAPEIRVIDTSPWWISAAWGTVCVYCGRQRAQWGKKCSCGGDKWQSQFLEAYRKEIVNNPIRNMHVAALVRDLDRPTLVLVKQVAHGRTLEDMLPQAEFLSGRNLGSERTRIYNQMREGRLRTLICTTIADMGLDIPALGALVLAGGGKSSVRHLQRIGRVVRTHPGKQRPLVIDLDDSHIHRWFANHAGRRRQIEREEWGDLATWTT